MVRISQRTPPGASPSGAGAYWLHAYFLALVFIGLFADSRVTALWQQDVLGGLTFTALILAALRLPAGEQRIQVALVVVIATGFEIFASLVWGIYRYRFDNLPLYVPAGHGVVYMFGLLAGGTPLVRRHGRRVAYAVLAAAALWALLGLVALPRVTGRIDVEGALLLPCFAYFILRSPRWPLFAGIFVIVAALEICGTSFGTWSWAAVAPWTHIPSGNPPSVVAGGYCVIDATMLGVLWLVRSYSVGWKTIRMTMTTTISPSSGPIMRLLRASRRYSGEEVSPESASLI